MKAYEDRKYAVWKEYVNATLMSYLKKNLLVRPIISSAGGRTSIVSATTDIQSVSVQKFQGKL